jgi:exosortase family protein XrtF
MLKEYKDALLFLGKYIALYIVLNTMYAWYVQHYSPNADPITKMVTHHSAAILHAFDDEVSLRVISGKSHVPITKNDETVIEVFEGCNSINVFIVFLSFIIAFQGSLKLFVQFLFGGMGIIYLINLLRIIALYVVALKFPDALYFFHKFFFTGIIYLIVFALWYLWTVKVKQWRLQKT